MSEHQPWTDEARMAFARMHLACGRHPEGGLRYENMERPEVAAAKADFEAAAPWAKSVQVFTIDKTALQMVGAAYVFGEGA